MVSFYLSFEGECFDEKAVFAYFECFCDDAFHFSKLLAVGQRKQDR